MNRHPQITPPQQQRRRQQQRRQSSPQRSSGSMVVGTTTTGNSLSRSMVASRSTGIVLPSDKDKKALQNDPRKTKQHRLATGNSLSRSMTVATAGTARARNHPGGRTTNHRAPDPPEVLRPRKLSTRRSAPVLTQFSALAQGRTRRHERNYDASDLSLRKPTKSTNRFRPQQDDCCDMFQGIVLEENNDGRNEEAVLDVVKRYKPRKKHMARATEPGDIINNIVKAEPHPKKSTSFQSDPEQILQVYKDLHQQDQRRSTTSLATLSEGSVLATENNVTNATATVGSLESGVSGSNSSGGNGSSSSSSREMIMSRNHCGRSKQVVQSGENFIPSLSQQYHGTNPPAAGPSHSSNGSHFRNNSQDEQFNVSRPERRSTHPKKEVVQHLSDGGILYNMNIIPRRGSVEGENTLVTVASTSTDASTNDNDDAATLTANAAAGGFDAKSSSTSRNDKSESSPRERSKNGIINMGDGRDNNSVNNPNPPTPSSSTPTAPPKASATRTRKEEQESSLKGIRNLTSSRTSRRMRHSITVAKYSKLGLGTTASSAALSRSLVSYNTTMARKQSEYVGDESNNNNDDKKPKKERNNEQTLPEELSSQFIICRPASVKPEDDGTTPEQKKLKAMRKRREIVHHGKRTASGGCGDTLCKTERRWSE